MTKFGFTIFRNVSIARIGDMEYAPHEVMIEPGDNGLVIITRAPEEVFRPETLASINGAPFTIDHPGMDVTPENWKELTHGFFVDARRGSGDQRDEIVADLVVTTPEALAEIDLGTREVSMGYDADYYQTGPGQGTQRNIIANHVALVEAGRCGSRCAVRDKALTPKSNFSFWAVAAVAANYLNKTPRRRISK